MMDPSKTNQLLIEENTLLLQRIKELEQAKAEHERIKEESRELFLILEAIPNGILLHDADGNFLYANQRTFDLHGYSRDEFMALNLRRIAWPTSKKLIATRINELLDRGEMSFEVEHVKKDGMILPLWINVTKTTWRGKNVFLSVQTDITERKRDEEKLKKSELRYRELSMVDALTELYNSRYFYHQIKTEISRAERYRQPLTLLIIDLDDFKQFNDTYGHVEGDQVLSRLGQIVKRCLRQTDSAYRYGGEEFAILLPMTTADDGTITAERIRAEFKNENFSPMPGQEAHMTMSIGLAQYKPQEEMKAFVHRVDQLMYQGKKNGKDRICSEL